MFSSITSFKNINYGEQLLKSIIATRYAKGKLSVLLMMIATSILRLHLSSMITIMLSYNPYVDFFTQIVVSIVAVFQTNRIYNFVELFKPRFYSLTRYIINNYTPERYRCWKRNVTLCICLYIIIVFSLFDITSNLVKLYTIQYVICYGVVDIIEQRKIEKIIKNYKDRPKRVIYAEINVIDEFYKQPDIKDMFIDERSYTHNTKPKNDKMCDSSGKIGFVIIDDYCKKDT